MPSNHKVFYFHFFTTEISTDLKLQRLHSEIKISLKIDKAVSFTNSSLSNRVINTLYTSSSFTESILNWYSSSSWPLSLRQNIAAHSVSCQASAIYDTESSCDWLYLVNSTFISLCIHLKIWTDEFCDTKKWLPLSSMGLNSHTLLSAVELMNSEWRQEILLELWWIWHYLLTICWCFDKGDI